MNTLILLVKAIKKYFGSRQARTPLTFGSYLIALFGVKSTLFRPISGSNLRPVI